MLSIKQGGVKSLNLNGRDRLTPPTCYLNIFNYGKTFVGFEYDVETLPSADITANISKPLTFQIRFKITH